MNNRAIVLLSGGIDSCVTLAYALDIGRICTALSFHYQQRHLCELTSAHAIANHYGLPHITIHIDPTLFAQAALSSLTNSAIPLGTSTYVPCRNLLFLAHAASLLESTSSSEIYFGAHAQDSPTYPDCQPHFFSAFETTVLAGSHVPAVHIKTPLLHLDKASVVRLGLSLKAPLHHTWSCYDPQDGKPCRICQACLLRENSGCPAYVGR